MTCKLRMHKLSIFCPSCPLVWLISNTIVMQNWSRHLEQKLSDVMWRRQFNEARKWNTSQCASKNLNRRCSRIYCHITWKSLLSLSLRRHKRKREPGRVFLWNFCRLHRTVFVYGNDLQTTRSIFKCRWQVIFRDGNDVKTSFGVV